MITKKDLLTMVITFLICVFFLLAMAWNVKQYDAEHPVEKQQINIEKYS